MWLWRASKNVLKLGIKNSDSIPLTKQLVLLNFAALIWVFPLLLSAVFFITTDYWHYGLLMFMSIAFLFLVPILNSFRQFQLATFLYIITIHFNLIMSNVIAEFHFETYLLLIPLIVHLYFLHDSVTKLILHYTAILSVYGSSFFLVKLFPYTALTQVDNSYYIAGNYLFTGILLVSILLLGAYLRRKEEAQLFHFQEEERLKYTALLANYRKQQTIIAGVKNRSKNNISLLSNILTLQRLEIEDEQAKKQVLAVAKRLKVISSLQNFVYDYPDFMHIPLHDVFQEAIDLVLVEEGIAHPAIHVQIDIDPVFVPAEKAIAIAIVSYELILNAYKHAFPSKTGKIEIQLTCIGDTKYIRIQDNGVGLDEDDLEENVGFTILGNYANQLNIQHERVNSDGTKITLIFQ